MPDNPALHACVCVAISPPPNPNRNLNLTVTVTLRIALDDLDLQARDLYESGPQAREVSTRPMMYDV